MQTQSHAVSGAIRVSSMIKSCFPVTGMGEGRGDTFVKGILYPAFRQKEGEYRAFPAFAVSQLPSVQNHPYAKVAYFGVA